MVFVSCVLAGALRASLLVSGSLVCKLVSNVLWWAVCPFCCPLRAAKRAAQLSRPSWAVFALSSVSGGSGTVEGLSSAVDSHPVHLRAAGVLFLPFWYLRASYGPFERRQLRLVSSLVGDRFKGRTP